MYSFEKLKVWQKSLELIKDIYRTCEELPKQERTNLIDQIKRAATSINLNIAEGGGAENKKENKRFLYMARKSLYEVVAILLIIERLYKIDITNQRKQVDEVGKMLNGLIKSYSIS
jgi:four helix bundle protein